MLAASLQGKNQRRGMVFQSDRNGDPAVFWQPADGGTAEPVTTPDRGTSHTPESWSPDGEVLLFSAGQTQSGSDPAQIQVVLNWFEELKARAPSSRR